MRLQRSLRLAFACQHFDPALLETDHDQEQTPSHGSAHPDGNCTDACDCGPGLPCGEYLWDHRNGSMLQDFLVNEYILGPDGVGNKNITGVFIDDYWCYGEKVRLPPKISVDPVSFPIHRLVLWSRVVAIQVIPPIGAEGLNRRGPRGRVVRFLALGSGLGLVGTALSRR